jgi:ditrans,polycis-polyprenyl diphosphate synthase
MLKKINDKISNFVTSTLCGIFKIGAYIPKSVAVIMDGNRRYAEKKNFQKIKGHEDGLNKLLDVLLWCIELEIKELSVFAFSIDNFNRSKDEVDSLMNLAKEKFARLSEKNELLNKYGVKVCFYGNIDFLDDEMRNTVNKIEEQTESNSIIKLNVCFPYNSTEEIYSAVNKAKQKSHNEKLDYRSLLESNLYGQYNCNPDILIRTSGEVRLSNYLLYQTRFAMLFFVDKFWPDFQFKDFLSTLLRYNIYYKEHLKKINELESHNEFILDLK